MGDSLANVDAITVTTWIMLVVALGLAFSFEFVNGFHDTANAVATVIYTNTLKPPVAVVWSGLWNLTGVLFSSGAVAYGIVALLPVELVLNVGSGAGFAMVFSLLVSAIIWNVGTWYLGLPASSSHTLIGSIVGVGLMNSLIQKPYVFGDGVNWGKLQDTLTALVVSPIVGFVCAGLLLLIMKALIKMPALYSEPDTTKPPPPLIRALLILTCTGVSFAHGSNDGQKGMGLIMLILIGILPAYYAVNMSIGQPEIATFVSASSDAGKILHKLAPQSAPMPSDQAASTLSAFLKSSGKVSDDVMYAVATKNDEIGYLFSGHKSLNELPEGPRKSLRSDIYLVGESISKLLKKKAIADPDQAKTLGDYQKKLSGFTKYIPLWVKVAVAFCLGLGTMIGWKRIVVTVGERIGKEHLTYGQGAAAEIVAWATIQGADNFGLPVSTTHILSSGVAGTMAANGSGLQMQTLRNILLAWVLTLPVCIFLGAMFFAAGFYLVAGRAAGVH